MPSSCVTFACAVNLVRQEYQDTNRAVAFALGGTAYGEEGRWKGLPASGNVMDRQTMRF